MEITYNLKKGMADMFQNLSRIGRSILKDDKKLYFRHIIDYFSHNLHLCFT